MGRLLLEFVAAESREARAPHADVPMNPRRVATLLRRK